MPYRQGNEHEIAAGASSNEKLASDLYKLAGNSQAFPRAKAKAILNEAARRLQWGLVIDGA